MTVDAQQFLLQSIGEPGYEGELKVVWDFAVAAGTLGILTERAGARGVTDVVDEMETAIDEFERCYQGLAERLGIEIRP